MIDLPFFVIRHYFCNDGILCICLSCPLDFIMGKHLTLEDRIEIEIGIKAGCPSRRKTCRHRCRGCTFGCETVKNCIYLKMEYRTELAHKKSQKKEWPSMKSGPEMPYRKNI